MLRLFDWTQFDAGQVSLLDENDDGPLPQAPLLVTPPIHPPTLAPVLDRAALRGTARTAVLTASGGEAVEPAADTPTPKTTQVVFGADYSMPASSDWRPEPPPCLDEINNIQLDCETSGLKWWGWGLRYRDSCTVWRSSAVPPHPPTRVVGT